MTDIRQARRDVALSQLQCADLLSVPVNTFRMWDSGLRPAPVGLLDRLRIAIEQRTGDSELLSLDQLAREFHVHQRTLRDAARAGRLAVVDPLRVRSTDSSRYTTCRCPIHGALLPEIVFAICLETSSFDHADPH